MVLAVLPTEVTILREKEFTTERSLLPVAAIEQENYELLTHQRLGPDSSIDTRGIFYLGDSPLQLKEGFGKIEPAGFLFNYPWLPPNAIKLLNKAKKGALAEKELITLMEMLAERASAHFQLGAGKFVALTFRGRVVEVSDTRVGLLKRLQGRKYPEQIFVWRIGFNAFSGRL